MSRYMSAGTRAVTRVTWCFRIPGVIRKVGPPIPTCDEMTASRVLAMWAKDIR